MDSCWVLTDGAAGNENQALALAQALGLQPRVLRLRPTAPWRWLAPSGPRDPRRALPAAQRGLLQAPWPRLAIGCGRASALITSRLRVLSGAATSVVQILDPRRRRGDFDALIVPEHDGLTGSNVITCLGALNGIDEAWLAAGRTRFPAFAQLPEPRTAVLIGGPVRGLRMDDRYIDALLARLGHWQMRDGGSFLVTCSRRTPPAVVARLRRFFANAPGVFWADASDGDNPYAGLLAWAERIVVTPDSANLLSEACATGVPVLAYSVKPLPGKLGAFARALVESGRLRPLQLKYSAWRYPPLRELPRVAAELRQRLRLGCESTQVL